MARRLSIRADFLEKRSHASGVDFQHLMQSDFVLFLVGCLNRLRGRGVQWYPETLLYSQEYYGAFEIFVRAQSNKYFTRLCSLLDIKNKNELASVLQALQGQQLYIPRWEFQSIDSSTLMGFDKLATIP
jgi:hypothetical protein